MLRTAVTIHGNLYIQATTKPSQ